MSATQWIEHDGKSVPVSATTRVHVRFRDGSDDTIGVAIPASFRGEDEYTSNWFFGGDDITPYDIVAYRVEVLQ